MSKRKAINVTNETAEMLRKVVFERKIKDSSTTYDTVIQEMLRKEETK